MKSPVKNFTLVGVCLLCAFVVRSFAQQDSMFNDHEDHKTPSLVQIVALDECDPMTFNEVLGPEFCYNVAFGIQHNSGRIVF